MSSPLPLTLPGPDAKQVAAVLVSSTNSRSVLTTVPGQNTTAACALVDAASTTPAANSTDGHTLNMLPPLSLKAPLPLVSSGTPPAFRRQATVQLESSKSGLFRSIRSEGGRQ